MQKISFSISYWHTLETTRNRGSLLDAAYQECKRNRHEFHENAKYLLTLNGLGQITSNPQMFNTKQVKKIVKQCLSDQCRQNINSRIEEEDKFITLRKCINTSDTNKPYYAKIGSAFIRKCFSKLRLDGASKFSSCNEECVRCGVEKSTPHIMMDCILGSERRSKLTEKLIKAFEGYEYLTKMQKNDLHAKSISQ